MYMFLHVEYLLLYLNIYILIYFNIFENIFNVNMKHLNF